MLTLMALDESTVMFDWNGKDMMRLFVMPP